MTRRANIQHGRRRRIPPGILWPIVMIVVLLPVLVWELTLLVRAVIE